MEKQTMLCIEQAIMNEDTFPERDPAGQQDEMYYRLGELVLCDILTPEEKEEIMAHYTRVFHHEGR
jgi:hypothetical protein